MPPPAKISTGLRFEFQGYPSALIPCLLSSTHRADPSAPLSSSCREFDGVLSCPHPCSIQMCSCRAPRVPANICAGSSSPGAEQNLPRNPKPEQGPSKSHPVLLMDTGRSERFCRPRLLGGNCIKGDGLDPKPRWVSSKHWRPRGPGNHGPAWSKAPCTAPATAQHPPSTHHQIQTTPLSPI